PCAARKVGLAASNRSRICCQVNAAGCATAFGKKPVVLKPAAIAKPAYRCHHERRRRRHHHERHRWRHHHGRRMSPPQEFLAFFVTVTAHGSTTLAASFEAVLSQAACWTVLHPTDAIRSSFDSRC